jgi:hypothetical protein
MVITTDLKLKAAKRLPTAIRAISVASVLYVIQALKQLESNLEEQETRALA